MNYLINGLITNSVEINFLKNEANTLNMFKRRGSDKKADQLAKTIQDISRPRNVERNYHATYCPETNRIIGLPKQWDLVINNEKSEKNVTRKKLTLYHALSIDSNIEKQYDPGEVCPTPPELPEKKGKHLDASPVKKSNNYVNIQLKSELDRLHSNEDVIKEMMNVCYHENPNEYEKYINEQEIGEGASGECKFVFIDTND